MQVCNMIMMSNPAATLKVELGGLSMLRSVTVYSRGAVSPP